MNTSIAKTSTCLLVFTSEGAPVMVVPAASIQDGMTQAHQLLGDESCTARTPIARSGVRVTLFAPAIFGDDEVLGFLPMEYGESHPDRVSTPTN